MANTTTTYAHGDQIWFGSREFNTSPGRATYLFDQQKGIVNCATNDTVDVTAANGKFYRFTVRKNGEFVPQGQSQDPKGRNTLNKELEDSA